VRFTQGDQRFGAEQRRVSRQDDGDFGALADRPAGDLHGVTCAVLGLLQNGLGAELGGQRPNLVSLVSHDDENLRSLERLAGAEHVLD